MPIAVPLVLAAVLAAPVAPSAPPEAVSAKPVPSRSIYALHPVADAAVIAGSTIAAAIPYLFARQLIHPRCPCDRAEVNALDRGAIGNSSALADHLSDVTMIAAVVAPVAFDVLDLGLGARKELLEDAVVYAEVLAINTALVSVTKTIVQRPLPRVYAMQAPGLIDSPDGYRSFYSGHTTTAVAALSAGAMTYTLRHGDSAWSRTWPWLTTAVVGGSVAVERVLAGRHFITDVAVGAAVGAAVGTLVPLLHARGPAGRLSIVPAEGGAMLSWTLRN
jgi:membrane-associated phospholipid phosphatase